MYACMDLCMYVHIYCTCIDVWLQGRTQDFLMGGGGENFYNLEKLR